MYPIVECYNVDEEYLYNKTYLFIQGYATGRGFKNTLKALPLARKIHNGQYRKGLVEVSGQQVRLPYILHCLKVCSTLISLNLMLPDEELDVLYTCALLHDTLEDGEEFFPKGGIEYEQDYGFPPEVTETIKLLRSEAPSCKIMVGGAVLNQEYADLIAADFYAKDAKQSVDIAKIVLG